LLWTGRYLYQFKLNSGLSVGISYNIWKVFHRFFEKASLFPKNFSTFVDLYTVNHYSYQNKRGINH